MGKIAQSAGTPSRNGGDFSDNVQPGNKGPTGMILVKGAWASASDSVTPLPEGGNVTNSVFTNQYFGMSYTLPPNWEEKYTGPPPSDSGRYVLTQINRSCTHSKDRLEGTILITAQDLFFHSAAGTRTRSNWPAIRRIICRPTTKWKCRRPRAQDLQIGPFTFLCLLVSCGAIALVRSDHRHSLSRCGNRADQPRHETAGELDSGLEQNEVAGGSQCDGRNGR